MKFWKSFHFFDAKCCQVGLEYVNEKTARANILINYAGQGLGEKLEKDYNWTSSHRLWEYYDGPFTPRKALCK